MGRVPSQRSDCSLLLTTPHNSRQPSPLLPPLLGPTSHVVTIEAELTEVTLLSDSITTSDSIPRQVQQAASSSTLLTSQDVAIASNKSRPTTIAGKFNEAHRITGKGGRLRNIVIAAAAQLNQQQTPTDAATRRFEEQSRVIFTNILTLYKQDRYKTLTNPLIRALLDDITGTDEGRDALITLAINAYTRRYRQAMGAVVDS